MTARKKKRKRAAMVEGLTREEMYEMMDEMYRAMEKGMAKAEPTMEEIRRAIEAARYAIGEVGEFHVESGEEGYTIACPATSRGGSRMTPVPEESSSCCPTRRSGGRTRTAAGTGALWACTSI